MSRLPSEVFQAKKYLVIKNFLPDVLVNYAYRYALMKVETSQCGTNPQVPGAPSLYADTLMETILERSVPKMEALTGIMLYPTYSFMRVYQNGDVLNRHYDRPSCEISVTCCLGYHVGDETDANYNWPIYVYDNKDSKERADVTQTNLEGMAIHLQPGDCLVYRGSEVMHWREAFEGSAHGQVFLHYVDRHGPFKDYKFDGRKFLGVQKE